jgi:hypothetical protein
MQGMFSNAWGGLTDLAGQLITARSAEAVARQNAAARAAELQTVSSAGQTSLAQTVAQYKWIAMGIVGAGLLLMMMKKKGR